MLNELMRQKQKKDKAQMVEYWNAQHGSYNGKTKYYKVLDERGRSCHGGSAVWSLPTRNADGTWTPGDWMPEVGGILRLCLTGYHIVTIDQLLDWLGPRIFEVEIGSNVMRVNINPDLALERTVGQTYLQIDASIGADIIHGPDKSVVRQCRLTRECIGWNEWTARLFACECAEKVLYIYEAEYPHDNRPRRAIEATRKYVKAVMRNASDAEIAEASCAAEAAYRAAHDASMEAIGNTARYAAYAAELASAVGTAEDKFSTYAAGDVARAAIDAIAAEAKIAASKFTSDESTIRAAAETARAKMRQWQVKHLSEILEKEE